MKRKTVVEGGDFSSVLLRCAKRACSQRAPLSSRVLGALAPTAASLPLAP